MKTYHMPFYGVQGAFFFLCCVLGSSPTHAQHTLDPSPSQAEEKAAPPVGQQKVQTTGQLGVMDQQILALEAKIVELENLQKEKDKELIRINQLRLPGYTKVMKESVHIMAASSKIGIDLYYLLVQRDQLAQRLGVTTPPPLSKVVAPTAEQNAQREEWLRNAIRVINGGI